MQARWYVAGVDGSPHGPYDAAALVQYVSEGRVNGGTRLCREGEQTWIAASMVPELGIAPIAVDDGGMSVVMPMNVAPNALTGCWLGVFSMILPFVPIGPIAILISVLGLRLIRRPDNTLAGRGRTWVGIVTGSIATLGTVLIYGNLLIANL